MKHDAPESSLADAGRRAEVIQGIRDLADWLEERPGVPLHQSPYYGSFEIAMFGAWFEGDPISTSPRRVARAMGKAEKEAPDWSQHFSLARNFGGGVRYVFHFDREAICRPKVVGQVEKKETLYEINGDLVKLADLESREVTVGHTDKVVYDCEPLLSRAGA